MKCPKCNNKLKEVKVKVAGAKNKALSYQCSKCDYFSFEKTSSNKVLGELRDTPLKMKQRVIKLSGERLGMYFNNDIVRSLGLRKGEDVFVSVPDKNHILIEISR